MGTFLDLQRIPPLIRYTFPFHFLMKSWFATAFCFAIIPMTLSGSNDDEMPLDIQVRSEIDRPFKGWGREDPKDHGKVYLLAAITEARSEQQLVMPVDEKVLIKHLRAELAKRGYREYTPEEPPELVLTILYGRGYLKNPYLKDAMYNEMFDPPVSTILAGNPKQLMRQKEYGYEEKLQAANFEKLFIQVNAWAHPDTLPEPKKGKKKKPKLLWKTTMITDDPMHRDLNQFIEKLLAAGSEFFDREMEDDEAFIRTDLPAGFIEYGDTVIIDDQKK